MGPCMPLEHAIARRLESALDCSGNGGLGMVIATGCNGELDAQAVCPS